MDVIRKNLNLIGKPGKVISLIFLIPSFIIVVVCLVLELFFKDFVANIKSGNPEEPNYGGAIIFFILFFFILFVLAVKVVAVFSFVTSLITFILSIVCLRLADKEKEDILNSKVKIYVVTGLYFLLALIYIILAIVTLSSDAGIFVLPCVVLSVIYSIISSKMINSINLLNSIDRK